MCVWPCSAPLPQELAQGALTAMPSVSGRERGLMGSPIPSALQIKYHEEFEKSRMGPSGGEGIEPERREAQDSYRRPTEQQQPPPHHIPTSAPGECREGRRGPEVKRGERGKCLRDVTYERRI